MFDISVTQRNGSVLIPISSNELDFECAYLKLQSDYTLSYMAVDVENNVRCKS